MYVDIGLRLGSVMDNKNPKLTKLGIGTTELSTGIYLSAIDLNKTNIANIVKLQHCIYCLLYLVGFAAVRVPMILSLIRSAYFVRVEFS